MGKSESEYFTVHCFLFVIRVYMCIVVYVALSYGLIFFFLLKCLFIFPSISSLITGTSRYKLTHFTVAAFFFASLLHSFSVGLIFLFHFVCSAHFSGQSPVKRKSVKSHNEIVAHTFLCCIVLRRCVALIFHHIRCSHCNFSLLFTSSSLLLI